MLFFKCFFNAIPVARSVDVALLVDIYFLGYMRFLGLLVRCRESILSEGWMSRSDSFYIFAFHRIILSTDYLLVNISVEDL